MKRRGWYSTINFDDQNMLQFADGSIGRTEGSISVSWKFPRAYNQVLKRGFKVKFHVLRGCTYYAILGQDMLEASNAFSSHENAFESISEAQSSGLNLIIWLGKKSKPGTSQNAPRDTERLRLELQRRAVTDRITRRIQNPDERLAAIANEERIRIAYDNRANSISHGPSQSDGASSRSAPQAQRPMS